MGCGCGKIEQAVAKHVGPFHAILIGPPGVGKGTQCDRLAKKVKYEHISTGDLVRAEIKANSEIGQKIRSITEAGGLVPDKIVCALLTAHLTKFPKEKSWMLDGFPRTEFQAKFLKEGNLGITHVIELTGDEKEITERLGGRLFDPKTNQTFHKVNNPPPEDIKYRCVERKDDSPAVIADRFKVFRESAAKIRELFGELVVTLDTKGKTIDAIEALIDKMLL